MTVYCENCDHVHPATRGNDPWHWRCLRAPVAAGHGFVSRTYSPSPPYAKCERLNMKGECDQFEPRRMPKESEQ